VTPVIQADGTLDLTFTPAQTGVADITIRATDPDGRSIEDTFRITVRPPVATTTLITQASPNPSTFGQAVTFTVTVTPAEGTELPTGTLTFKAGATTLGTSTSLADVGGVATATFTTSATQLGGGTHTISAVYAGAEAFLASISADFTQTVSPAATTMTIVQATPAVSIVGQSVTFTIRVSPGVGGVVPTGSLTMKDGALTLGTSTPLIDVSGVATATFTTAAGQLGVGPHALTALFAGDANFAAGSSGAFPHLVNPLTALADVYTVKQNRKLNAFVAIGLLANDRHVSGLATLVKKPAKGKLTLRPDGSFVYKPLAGFVGKVTFKYRLVSPFGVSGNVVVTIKVKR
jgi:hypothetical protein